MKQRGEKITALTAYDYPTARLLDESGIDIILVGDSVGMVVLGYQDTTDVTLDEMLHHTRAAARGVKQALLVADMPIHAYDTPDKLSRPPEKFVDAGATGGEARRWCESCCPDRGDHTGGNTVYGAHRHAAAKCARARRLSNQRPHAIGGRSIAGATPVRWKTPEHFPWCSRLS